MFVLQFEVSACQKVGHIVKQCAEKEEKPKTGKKKWSAKSKFEKKIRNSRRFISSKKIWQSGNRPTLQSQIPMENVKILSYQ